MREPQVGPPGSRGHSLGLVGLPYLAAVHSSQPSVHSSGTGSRHPGMASGDRSSADAPSAWWPCSGTHSCTPPSFPKPTQGAAGPALKLKRVTRVAAMPKGEAAPSHRALVVQLPCLPSCHRAPQGSSRLPRGWQDSQWLQQLLGLGMESCFWTIASCLPVRAQVLAPPEGEEGQQVLGTSPRSG